MKYKFRQLSNDLYCDIQCTCPHDLFKDTPVTDIMKHSIKLSGYMDANFFDNVNKEPRILNCKCGRKLKFQWFRDGVEAEFIEETPNGI